MKLVLHLIWHSFMQRISNRGDIFVFIGFFLIFMVLAGISIGKTALAQPEIGVGLLWLGLLLALHMAAQGRLQREEEQGMLVQMQLLPVPLGAMLLARHLGSFLALMLPLLCCIPLAGLLFNLSWDVQWHATLCLCLGGWSYWLLLQCTECLLLGVSVRGAGLPLLLVLPLGVPLLIFGAEASLRMASEYGNAQLFLGAIALAITAISPWLLAGLIRQYRGCLRAALKHHRPHPRSNRIIYIMENKVRLSSVWKGRKVLNG